MSSERVRVVDIGLPLYLTVVLSEGFNQDILDFHGYASLYHFFMGFVGAPISYKDGCKWTGSKNFTIKGITFIYLKQLRLRLINLFSDIFNESSNFESVSEIIHQFYINYCGNEECKTEYFAMNELDTRMVLIYASFKLSFLIPLPAEAKSISEFGVALNFNFSYEV